MKSIFSITFLIVVMVIGGCIQRDESNNEPIVVDFSKINRNKASQKQIDSVKELKIAFAAMFSPLESFDYYKDLATYISQKINMPIKIIQRKTYQEINLMLRKNQVDIAFICSGAYAAEHKKSGIEILAVPVCYGKPFYQAYIIANKSSDIKRFTDFRGKTFAFTDPLSNTGKLFADKKLSELGTTADLFFSKTVFTHAHDISMQLISKNIIDGATVDGLIYKYIERFRPDRVANLKIIEKSEEFGIPPIVIPKGMDENLKKRLKDIFLTMNKDSVGRKILNKLLIDKFVEGNDSNYNNIRQIKMMITK